MIVLPFLAGGLTMVGGIVVFRLWLGMLPRSICPQCGQHTVAVGHPISRTVGRWVSRRWCSAYEWTGWGRKGPVRWRRRGPVADGSGFRWGEDRLQPDMGFQWQHRERSTSADRPASPKPLHPSGFHFADEGAETSTDAEAPMHPSGFCFRETAPAEPAEADHPSGFSWGAGDAPNLRPGFNWGSAAPRKPRLEGGSEGGSGGGQGFRWRN